jgi:Family of unknown function (DUF6496)
MAKTTPRQRKTTGRVMHEYKHGELKHGRGGKGGKVKNRKQAIAIALHEAGASKYETKSEKSSSRAKSKRKEASGRTGQQELEGKSRVSADGAKARARWAERTPPKRRGTRPVRRRALPAHRRVAASPARRAVNRHRTAAAVKRRKNCPSPGAPMRPCKGRAGAPRRTVHSIACA